MIRLLSFLLIAQFGYALSLKTFYVIDWELNQAYITEKYCENKAKPMMNCNGKCYLAKQIDKVEQQEQDERNEHPNPKQKIEKAEVLLFMSSDAIAVQVNPLVTANRMGEVVKPMISQPHLNIISPPPQV